MSICNVKRICLIGLLLCNSVLVGQFYFGRNKIQYEQFDWRVLETEHFNIYYYPEETELVQFAAHTAESAFSEFEQKFNHTVHNSIPLIIYSNHIHFQQTNVLTMPIPEGVGGFFEFLKRRVVLPYTGDMAAFRHVIRHELIHVFMHHKIASLSNKIGLWDAPHFPLWFTEGLAELWSQSWDSGAELIIRDAALHDYLYPLGSYQLLASGYLLYKVGQAFLIYYQDTYHPDRLRLLMEEFWKYESFEETFRAVTGRPLDEVYEAWKLHLKQRFARSLQSEDVLPPGQYQITETGINVSPQIYRNEKGKPKLVFMTNRYGYTDVYAKPLGSSKSKPVVRGERKAGRESLHLLQTDFGLNSDGQLALVCKSGGRDVIRIYDIKTHRELKSLQHPRLVTIRSPQWSPDQRSVVFNAQDNEGRNDLYLWKLSEQRAIRLTDDLFCDRQPCFDPSGDWLVFSSDRTADSTLQTFQLFLYHLQNQQIYQLTSDPCQHISPRWDEHNPHRIYYLSDRSGTMNLYALTIDPARLTENRPVWAHQLTRYHTGLKDICPYSPDSLFVSAFLKYDFQIHHIPISRDSSDTLQAGVIETIPRTSPLLPKTEFATREKSQPYKLKYSLDFAQTAVAYDPIFGFLGGAQLSISDILGNRYYHFLVANTAETRSEIIDRFNVAVTLVDLTKRSNRALGIFHFANDYFDPYQGFYFERSFGIRGALNYPIDVFRRLEFSTSLWTSIKDDYVSKLTRAYLVSNYVSFVHDNALWTYTGPIDGWRFRFTIGPSFDFFRSQIHNYTVLFDLRYYYRIKRNLTFAQRIMTWYNDGSDIRRFYIGGSWGVRGYKINEVYGSKYYLINNELRFPFAKSLMLSFKKSGIGIAPIRSALFFDIASAWHEEYEGPLGSFGIGFRGYLLGGLVLRLDIGKRTDFQRLEKGLFCQFFFGWDY